MKHFNIADCTFNLYQLALISIPLQTEEKRQALLRAFNKHNKLMDEAQKGKGTFQSFIYINISFYIFIIIVTFFITQVLTDIFWVSI